MALIAEPATLVAEPMEPLPYRVVTRSVEGPDVVTIGLAPAGDRSVATPRPGQFLMVWANGVGEIPISVSGIGIDGALELTVRRVGATSEAIVDARVGDVLGARGPYGTAWPLEEADGRDAVVVAGGLGVAPLRLAIEGLVARRRDPHRLHVVIGARRPDQLLYADDYVRWREAGAQVVTTVDAADRDWAGAVGTATELLGRHDLRGDVAFVCGPELMMVWTARALLRTGMPAERIHVSLERNMHCGVAHCGRCQLGPLLLCRDGAVVRWDRVAGLMAVRGR
jgi:anaerobic sulfite reductase subunit B